MIINKRRIGWNWNIGRRNYESVEAFIKDNADYVSKIQENRAIIGSNYIEVGDNRTDVTLTFQKDSDILDFLKQIKEYES